MSANLIKERCLPAPKRHKRFHVSEVTVARREPVNLIQRYSIPQATTDEEMKFIKKAVTWMAVLAVAPLMLFHIIVLFYPNIFMIPAATN